MRKNLAVAGIVCFGLVLGGVFYLRQSPDGPAQAIKKAAKTKASIEATVPLAIGAKAPAFKTQGALDGKPFAVSLAGMLEEGPLVLYFFPKVFTQGCTLEAREFAEKTPEFNAIGANIIGMSGDDLNGLTRFGAEECRDSFAVAQATPDIIDGYGVAVAPGAKMTNRVSFVIDQTGTVRFVHSAPDYKDHVRLTLQAVKELQGDSPLEAVGL